MLHIHRFSLFFVMLCMGLSACVPATPLSTATSIPTETLTPTVKPPTETPTITPEPTAIPLDPEAWNEFGNVAIQNRNLAPYDKQLMVNPELEAQTAETIFRICNEYSYITAMAWEFNKTRSDAALPQSKYRSFENFMREVIQPAIDGGRTIEGWHLVGNTVTNKMPYRGMVEPLADFDPSICSIKIGGSDNIRPNGLIISVGAFQIGMNIINKNGKSIRELIINTNQTLKNGYGFFFANPKMSDSELSISFSQMLYTASQQINNVVVAIPTSSSSRNEFVFTPSKDTAVSFSFALPGTAGVDLVLQWMREAPNYFTSSTP